ncbi:MAG: diaminopimelate epimerase [Candidatus Parcubacteria bacterium]|nr:diaminopimelate epimerase [Candidatus Parcubacteria bacterium]
MNIGFTKMHGLGNDFIVIENMNGRIVLSAKQVVLLCDRHKGIGADGVILVEKSDNADAFMNYYNSDGTVAEMCGNGVRCVAKFLKDEIKKEETNFKIETRAGIKEIKYKDDGTFSVNMGKPVFEHADFPEKSLELEGLKLDFVSMGNPHAVAFVENLDDFILQSIGPLVENNKNFPNKINLEIVEKKSDNELIVKVWERGCGETLACGTGACAVYSIMKKNPEGKSTSYGAGKKNSEEIIINLPGGKLFMTENKMGEIIMRGPAESVFNGLVEII